MLVLSRKEDEEILIQRENEVIRLKIVRIDPGKVRVGITAPENVTILRAELAQKSAPK